MENKVLNIANCFSRYPAGRFITDGPYSGEKFRDDFLMPAIDLGEKLVIALDGARGYGSSFLEEAFGGLVRKGYSKEDILNTFTFQTKDESLKIEIMEYIEHAK
ncbi:MAG: STAS-like domain-containing protein [Candidatus Thiodiazotropha sp. (ex Lucinoma kastoroae)]|nr:STAS-like domain-containing protein [Candidatus Thiodiazotropha sp. (ex Lucinoma kastoroae)]